MLSFFFCITYTNNCASHSEKQHREEEMPQISMSCVGIYLLTKNKTNFSSSKMEKFNNCKNNMKL